MILLSEVILSLHGRALLSYKEQIEGRLRECLQFREELKVVEFRGDEWRLMAIKSDNGREIVDREALEREFGREWLRKYLKRTKPSVRVIWERVR